MRVLVTGAGALLGQGLIKSLRLASTQYEIVAVDPDPHAVGLYWADRAHLVPLVSESRYVEVLEQIVARERPQAILIGTDVELLPLAQRRDYLKTQYQACVLVSAPEVVRTADDKWLTYQFLRQQGYPHPQSALRDGAAELVRTCGFPLVVKPRVGARSAGVRYVSNWRELDLALQLVAEPIIQQDIGTPQREYTSGVLVSGGRARAVVTMRRDLKDGNTYRAYVETDAPYAETLMSLAETLGADGPINFQFRVADGMPVVFEINARFSGTTPLRAYAGFNEVDAAVRHFVCGDEIPEFSLTPMTILRYYDEILVQAHDVQAVAAGPARLSYQWPGVPALGARPSWPHARVAQE